MKTYQKPSATWLNVTVSCDDHTCTSHRLTRNADFHHLETLPTMIKSSKYPAQRADFSLVLLPLLTEVQHRAVQGLALDRVRDHAAARLANLHTT
jgi:hypothetical protein